MTVFAKRQTRAASHDENGAPRFARRRTARLAFVALLVLALFVPQALFARGGAGLRWGYVNDVQGYPLWNLWVMTNPWAQMSGWAIPNRGFAPNGLPPSSDPDSGGAPRSPYGNTWRTQPFDRNAVFVGSASQPSSYVPPARPSMAMAGSAAPLPTGPYRVDRTLYPPYFNNYNNYWRNGYWGGGLRGWAQWGKALAERAFPRWSVGPIYYLSGYGQYRNPFISLGAVPAAPYLDYRQPLVDFAAEENATKQAAKGDESVDDRAAAAAEEARRYLEAREFLVRSPQMTAGLKALDAAREAFRNKDYDTALRKTDEALQHLPHDAAFHEFRALVLFARGEYNAAATTIYAVLSVAPGWDWTTLSSMYADPEELTKHLRQLETYRKQHPESPEASFLLAYHYMTCRHAASAVRQLRNVARMLPDDNLVAPLITLLSGADDSPVPAPHENAPPAENLDKPVPAAPAEFDPEKSAGDWKASRAGSVVVELTLTEDGEFQWHVKGSAPRRFTGFYATNGDRVTLISPRGQLPGRIIPREGGGFRFTLSENDPTDSGLDFGK